jgi:uncharacterized protein
MLMTTILWRWLDREGHEAARLEEPVLRGSSVLRTGASVYALAYTIECDTAWRTIAARVRGWSSDTEIAIDITCRNGRWMMNGEHIPAVDGCIDVDLNFSPSTNLLPIRRLNLAVGEEATVRAAWLRFPAFTLEPLEQTYRRVAENTYRYQSASFTAEITVNEAGLVLEYGVWKAV